MDGRRGRVHVIPIPSGTSLQLKDDLSAELHTHPATPPLSMWLARVTSSLHTSNCHLRRPSTPHNTLPVWIPIRISTLKPVASRTNLHATWMREGYGDVHGLTGRQTDTSRVAIHHHHHTENMTKDNCYFHNPRIVSSTPQDVQYESLGAPIRCSTSVPSRR